MKYVCCVERGVQGSGLEYEGCGAEDGRLLTDDMRREGVCS